MPTTPAHIFKTARRQMRKIRHRGPQSDTERRLVASADQQREQGLGWRYDGFKAFSTEELLSALAKVGLPVTPESFCAEARAAGSPTALGETWAGRCTAQGKWRDLATLGARELWRRLLPELRCPEVVADEVDELLEEAEVSPDRHGRWLAAARKLLAGCVREGRGDREFFQRVCKESGSDLASWMLEMPASLLGTAHRGEAADLAEAFAGLGDEKALKAEWAEILSQVGRGDDARREISALLAQHGEDPVVLLKAGAVHEALGEKAAAQDFFRRYTDSMKQASSARAIAAASKAGVMLPTVHEEVGANDKCPCGSGKKYKRCHGLAS